MILEGDSKICFESIVGKYQSVDWSISTFTDNIRSLVKLFLFTLLAGSIGVVMAQLMLPPS